MLRMLLQSLGQLWRRNTREQSTLLIQPLPGIGDVIWFLPHLHALAKARGEISLMTKPRSMADRLLQDDVHVKHVIWLERKPGKHDGLLGFFRLVKLLRQGHYQEAWLFHNSARYAWALYFAGIPKTYGYGRGLQKALLTEAVFLSVDEFKLHTIEKAARLLQHAKIDMPDPQANFYVAAETVKQIEQRYDLANKKNKVVFFAIGSSDPNKQWGAPAYSSLATKLVEAGIQQIFLVGGSAEQTLANEIQASTGEQHCTVLINRPFNELAALASCCRFCVGNDTGLLNLAAATRIPSIGLFGVTYALSHSNYLIPISPPESSVASMSAIKVQQVIDVLTANNLI